MQKLKKQVTRQMDGGFLDLKKDLTLDRSWSEEEAKSLL
jgi:hypothetical protein